VKKLLHPAFALSFALIATTIAAQADGGFGSNSIGDNEFIIGGTLVPAGDPVAATTVLVTDGNFICTGSLIDTDMVVTAAHCTAANVADLKIVFATDFNSISQGEVRPITGLQANPGWQGEQATGADQHDIALMRINGSLPTGYHPAQLLDASASAALRKGDTTLLAGYGITNASTQDGAGVLREVEVPISKQLGQTEVILDQRKGKGACHGDSGGPAFTTDGRLWGVTNRGYPDNAPDDCAHYAVYTRIEAYADWISATETALRNGTQTILSGGRKVANRHR
jgi:secreted trypsin-like serine protease